MVLKPAVFVRLCRARDRLRTVDEPAALPDIARDAAMSPFHFIRVFDAVFGETPHRYRQRARIEHAKHLLASGEHSVTDACFAAGFSSVGSFSSLFAQRVGESPSSYRKRVRAFVSAPGRSLALLTPGCFSLMALAFAEVAANSKKHAPEAFATLALRDEPVAPRTGPSHR